MQIFITGITGFLGGEILVDLSKIKEVDKVFCLVRASNEKIAISRIEKVFNLHGDYLDKTKIIPVVGDLSDNQLTDKLLKNDPLRDVDTIIHSAANTSFSKIYDSVVERVNIEGTRQILEWAKSLKKLNLFTYVGTATICGSSLANCLVTEDMSPNVEAKHVVKYSYTKMIGELLLRDYLPEEKILVVRPSIIMGDSREWVPRSYVILWALAVFNQLRLLPVNANSRFDVIPVDYASRSIIELVMNKSRKHRVYHISTGMNSFTTPSQIAHAIVGFSPEKPDVKFVGKDLLGEMKKWAKNPDKLNEHSPLLPYKDYLDYWIDNFGDTYKLRMVFYALEPYLNFMELNQIFDNTRLLEDTGVGQSTPAHDYLKISGKHLNSINIFEGAVDS